jgi:hypothetical protein
MLSLPPLLLLLLFAAASISACPFSTINATGYVTNYTVLTRAVYVASNMTPPGTIYVCDGAVLTSADVLPIVLNASISIVGLGPGSVNGTNAAFNTSAATGALDANTFIFQVSGYAQVQMSSLTVFFLNNFVLVTQNARLSLTLFDLFSFSPGSRGVVVTPSLANAAPFVGQAVAFDFVSYGIVWQQTSPTSTLTCAYCRFSGASSAGIASFINNVAYMNLDRSVFVDCWIPIALIVTNALGSQLQAIPLPSAFVLNERIVTCRTYNCAPVSITASQSQSEIFGVAVGGKKHRAPRNQSKQDQEQISIMQYVIVALVALVMLVCVINVVTNGRVTSEIVKYGQRSKTPRTAPA